MHHDRNILLLLHPRRERIGELAQGRVRDGFVHDDETLGVVRIILRDRFDARLLEQKLLEVVPTIRFSLDPYLNFSQSLLGMRKATRSSVFLNKDLSNVRMN